MNCKFKTCKRWMGLLLSVLLVVEAPGMQTLAAETVVENPVIAEAEDVSANDVSSDVVVEDVSEGGVSEEDVSDSDARAGDVSAGDVTNSVSDADVVIRDVMAEVTVASTEAVASGTYYGMNWSIDTEGLLTIYGTYTGVWGGNDVKWSTNNADKITSAKVTATGVTATKEWFRALPNLQSVDFSEFDTSQVTQMYWMFIDCASLKEVDLSKFEDADVTDLSYMFMDCTSLTKVKFGNLDTSKVTDMSFMFQNCSSLETLDLSSFDTSSVKNMSGMFGGCKKLSSLDISSFNAGNVTNMRRMFYYCQALTELDLSHFNASDVTDMGVMFYECEKLAKLNLSGFDMSKVTDATNMLAYCDRLEELWAPKHLTLDIALDMNLMTKDEEIYSALPKNMAESVHLVRLKAYGDYYGVEWYLTNSGKLTITGTYGKGFGTTLWSDYKDDIVTVEANPSGMTSMKGWFQNHTKLKSVDFTGIDTGAVADMDKLFYGCTSLESVNLDALDTSQTKYMEQMFLNCKSLKSLDFSKLSTAALLLNNDMLTNCSGLEEVYCFKNLTDATAVTLPVTLVDSTGKKYTTMPVGQTESVLLQKPWAEGTWCGMSWSIAGDGHLAISGTYTATESTDAPWLAYADQITSAKVTATGVTSTKKWFYNLTNLKKVDLSGFDSSKVKNMAYMFYGCSSLTDLDLSKFSTASATSMYAMFHSCSGLTALDLSKFNTSKVTDMGSMFNGCKALTKLDLSGFNTAAVTNMSYMFYDCKALTKLVLNTNTFNTAKVTNMNRMFYNCEALTALDVSGFDTAAVTSMDCMFYNCASLTTLNVSNFNTAKVTHMGNMFYYCRALTELDVSGFDTSNVTYMGSMFNTCESLTELNVSGFDTSKVTDMTRMFFRCRNVKELDVSGFETGLVTKMDYMFEWCSNIEKLDMSKFDMANVVSATNMINGCGKLLNINTPKNLTLDVALPVTMIDDSFAEYTALPKNQTTSVAIRVPRTIAKDTYQGLDWELKENGYLTISGQYDSKAGGSCWTEDYADKIINVKVTATAVYETSEWFYGCTNLKSVDFSEFDSGNLLYTFRMFYLCENLTELDLSELDMSKILMMDQMFYGCSSLKSIHFGENEIAKVMTMQGCFEGCSSLTTVDLSGFDLSALNSEPKDLFEGCEKLEEIKAPKNLKYDVALPVALNDAETGLLRNDLPKNKSHSVLLKKAEIIASGIYCGMDWTINEFGGLDIFGTYTKTADADTMWKDYADQVYSVRITATGVTNTYHWFNNMTKLKSVDLSAFDASKVTTMNETFYNCTALTEVNLSNLNTSSVKNMYRMFYNCSALTELDVSSFDTSNVTDMAGMFGLCSGLTTLDVSNFNTANVTDMSYMFYKCSSLAELNVSKFNTANATTMRQMFYECSKLQSLDVSGFNTSLVTDMYAMFYMCSALTALDVSGFSTENVTNTNRMFWCCGKIAALDLSNFDMAAVTDADLMLYGCASAKQIKTPVNLALDVDLPAVYSNGTGVAYKTLPKNMTESVLLKKAIASGIYCGMEWIVEDGGNLIIGGTFGSAADTDTIWKDYANQVTSAKITAMGVTNTYHWFNNMTKMKSVDLSEFDSSKVTTMNEMFYNCSALEELDASNLNTSKVNNTYRMFYNCKALTKLDLSGCDFAAVTDATEMLTGCTSLGYIATPKNLAIDIALPAELEDKERNIYTALPKGLEESIVLSHVIYRIVAIEDQVYTGKAIKPALTVYKGSHVLTEGVDYTVSYKNNVNVADKSAKKAPTVTVKGKTNYMGNLKATFTIKAKEITDKNVTTTPTIVAKNGKVQKFKSIVTVDGKKLKLNKDYEIMPTDESEGAYKEPGKYSVNISGINNYTGTVTGTVVVLDQDQVQASKLKISGVSSCKYEEGVPATPEPKVTYKDHQLVKDVDYEVRYDNNDKAGKATLTIIGLENTNEGGTYVIGSVTKTFTIKGTALSKAKINYSKTVYYNGAERFPEVTLTIGDAPLQPGKDYTVEYTKNLNVGTGTIILKGCGGYTGTVKKNFKIMADPTVEERLTVAFVGGEAVAYYNAKGAKPEVVVKLGSKQLEPGKDYTVSYKNNKKIPAENVTEKKAPAVVIKGKGNYKFTKTVYFDIEPCPLGEITVTAADKFLGDKKGYLSAPVVKDGTKTLKKGKDYQIIGYETADGTAFDGKEEVENDTYVTVKVSGIGNYTGEEAVTYRIATKSISKVKITAKPLAYNEGKPVIYIGQDMEDGLLVLQDPKTKETLNYGEHYRITGYTNNTKTGTATMTIVGCGEYGGTRTVKFKIVKYKL